jgi:hypothetical protein
MNNTASVLGFGTKEETKTQLKLQLAQYLENKPESTRAFHKWMRRLEVAGLVLIAITFAVALYFSIIWKSVNPNVIAIAWFAFAGRHPAHPTGWLHHRLARPGR